MESILSNNTLKVNITIDITHKNVKGKTTERTIDVYMPDKNGIKTCVFSETTQIVRDLYVTKYGIAGAVNLLHALLLGNNISRFEKTQRRKNIIANSGNICKKLCFSYKRWFKFFDFKIKFFNIFNK